MLFCDCGYSVRCCEEFCPRCGDELVDERNLSQNCEINKTRGIYGNQSNFNPI